MGWIGQTRSLGELGPPPRRGRRGGNGLTNTSYATPAGPELPPSWGPIGSLLEKEDPRRAAQIRAQHEAMLAQGQAQR